MYVTLFVIQRPNSKWRPYFEKLKHRNKYWKNGKNTGKVGEKSGKFVSPEMWDPCLLQRLWNFEDLLSPSFSKYVQHVINDLKGGLLGLQIRHKEGFLYCST